MSIHVSRLDWHRMAHPLDASTYSRNHTVRLGGEQVITVSAPAEFMGDQACADPEQLLVGAVSSCHMLFFLAIAEQEGYVVETYEDQAAGYLEKASSGRLIINRIELYPNIAFGGDNPPDAAAIDRIHAAAHQNCFIGNSVIAEIVVCDRSRS